MANKETKLSIIIDAQNKADKAFAETEKSLKGISGTLDNLKPAFTTMAVVGGAAFAGISGIIYKSTEAASEAQKVQAQLAAVLQSTAGAAGVTADQALKLSKSLQATSTYGDEAVLGAENLLLTFTNIGKNVFPDATQAILDMSVAMGQDLQSSTIQIGKALNNPIDGITALTRVGVTFTESQKNMIEKLVESGKVMEAQKIILNELTREFGGSAKAQAGTFGGQIKQLKELMGDLGEEIGNGLLPILTKMVAFIKPIVEKMIDWASKHQALTATILILGAALSGIILVGGSFGLLLTGLISLMPSVVAAVTALKVAIGALSLETALASGGITLLVGGLTYLATKFLIGKTNNDQLSDSTKNLEKTMGGLKTGLDATGGSMSELSDKAKDARDKIIQLQKDIQATIKNSADTQIGLNADVGEAVVAQQTKINDMSAELEQKKADLKKQISQGITNDQLNEANYQISLLESQLSQEQSALEKNRDILVQYESQIDEARRRASETEFERRLEDIMKQKKQDLEQLKDKLTNQLTELEGLRVTYNQMTQIHKDYTKTVQDEENKVVASVKSATDSIISSLSSRAAAMGGNYTTSTPIKVNDAVITPNGQVVQTDPADYLIATKNPGSLMGGNGIVVNINGGTYLSEDAAESLGDMIISRLKLSNAI